MIRRKNTISWIIQVSILAAISVILYNFPKFQLPFFPSFLSVQFSMLPSLIASFQLGPFGGFLVVLIKFLFKLLTTRSAGVGELADLIIGTFVTLCAGLIYRYKRNIKGALLSIGASIIVWVGVALLSNYLLLIPTYSKLYGINTVLKMLTIIPGVTEQNYMAKYLLYACLPFNLMLSFTVGLVTLLVYKRISHLFKNMEKSINDDKHEEKFIKKLGKYFKNIFSVYGIIIPIVITITLFSLAFFIERNNLLTLIGKKSMVAFYLICSIFLIFLIGGFVLSIIKIRKPKIMIMDLIIIVLFGLSCFTLILFLCNPIIKGFLSIFKIVMALLILLISFIFILLRSTFHNNHK